MEKNTFDLAHNSKILIYGCGDLGKSIAQELILKKYNVVAFLDKNAARIKDWNNISVIDFAQIADIDKIEEYIILVMLHNGMSHEKVASECYKHGIVNIIYLPMHVNRNYENRYTMRRIYKFLSNYEFELVKDVPVYEMIDNNVENSKIIDIYPSGKIAFWCSLDNLKVGTLLSPNSIAKEYREYAYPEALQYQECDIKELTPYVNLFKWLKGENVNIDSYLRYTGRYSEEMRREWLEERQELYKIYSDALKHDLTFFTDAPSPCIWNSKGYFTFAEGLTRDIF